MVVAGGGVVFVGVGTSGSSGGGVGMSVVGAGPAFVFTSATCYGVLRSHRRYTKSSEICLKYFLGRGEKKLF